MVLELSFVKIFNKQRGTHIQVGNWVTISRLEHTLKTYAYTLTCFLDLTAV